MTRSRFLANKKTRRRDTCTQPSRWLFERCSRHELSSAFVRACLRRQCLLVLSRVLALAEGVGFLDGKDERSRVLRNPVLAGFGRLEEMHLLRIT